MKTKLLILAAASVFSASAFAGTAAGVHKTVRAEKAPIPVASVSQRPRMLGAPICHLNAKEIYVANDPDLTGPVIAPNAKAVSITPAPAETVPVDSLHSERFTVTNNSGTVIYDFSAEVDFQGTGEGDTWQESFCPVALAPGQSCDVVASWRPSASADASVLAVARESCAPLAKATLVWQAR